METTHELINASLICPKCHKRNIIDIMIPGIEYCSCPDGKFRPGNYWIDCFNYLLHSSNKKLKKKIKTE